MMRKTSLVVLGAAAGAAATLKTPLDLLRGTTTNAAFPPNPKAAVRN